jgi:hypothetical protein
MEIKKKIQHRLLFLSSLLITCAPIVNAYAAPARRGGESLNTSTTTTSATGSLESPPYVLTLIYNTLRIFRDAGVILLVYSIFSMILAMRNEDTESKVNASTQLVVAIVCVSFTSIARGLIVLVGGGNYEPK